MKEKVTTKVTLPPEPAPKAIPPVLLSSTNAATCTVKVGDTLPDLQLPDLGGQARSLSGLVGGKLTVVLFWSPDKPYSVEELADLAQDAAAEFGSQQVAIVAIAETTADKAKLIIQRAGAEKLTHLVDADGTALAKVATARLPRTYLVDAQRRVLWFDLEYSRSTRRDLWAGLRFALAK